MGYGGKYTQVKEALRELLRVKQEVFIPLIHRPGEARVDFGYVLVKISGAGILKRMETEWQFVLVLGIGRQAPIFLSALIFP